MTSYDVIFLGSSPDALVAAAYLARGGARVLVLEPNERFGGALGTEQFAHGFYGDVGLIGGCLAADIVTDLNLQEHGLNTIRRATISSLLSGGDSFTLPCEREAAVTAIQRLSSADASRYTRFMQLLDSACEVLRVIYSVAPPQVHRPPQPDVDILNLFARTLTGIVDVQSGSGGSAEPEANHRQSRRHGTAPAGAPETGVGVRTNASASNEIGDKFGVAAGSFSTDRDESRAAAGLFGTDRDESRAAAGSSDVMRDLLPGEVIRKREVGEITRLLVMSIRDLLDEWFEGDVLKGLLAGPAIRGLTQGPFAGGTAYNLLHHLAIGDGYFRATARGGMGGVVNALASAARASGAELKSGVGKLRVAVVDGIVTGVEIEGGETICGDRVVSSYDARYTFTELVPPPLLDPEFNRAVRHLRYNGSVARINLALDALPRFSNLSFEALKGTLVVAPDVSYIERAFDDSKYGAALHRESGWQQDGSAYPSPDAQSQRLPEQHSALSSASRSIEVTGGSSRRPYVEVTIPTLSDPELAPPGKHIMQIWCQYAPYRAGAEPVRVLEMVLDVLSEFSPELRSLVLHSKVLTPRDFERSFQLTEGHLYGGEMTLSQALFLRPIPGFAHYLTPVANLFMCGSSTHPGGGLSGLSGRNLALEIGAKKPTVPLGQA